VLKLAVYNHLITLEIVAKPNPSNGVTGDYDFGVHQLWQVVPGRGGGEGQKNKTTSCDVTSSSNE
jgi:hypothetical protein